MNSLRDVTKLTCIETLTKNKMKFFIKLTTKHVFGISCSSET